MKQTKKKKNSSDNEQPSLKLLPSFFFQSATKFTWLTGFLSSPSLSPGGLLHFCLTLGATQASYYFSASILLQAVTQNPN